MQYSKGSSTSTSPRDSVNGSPVPVNLEDSAPSVPMGAAGYLGVEMTESRQSPGYLELKRLSPRQSQVSRGTWGLKRLSPASLNGNDGYRRRQQDDRNFKKMPSFENHYGIFSRYFPVFQKIEFRYLCFGISRYIPEYRTSV